MTNSGDDPKLRASLVVRLLANDVLVAEVTDPILWHRTLGAIQAGVLPPETPEGAAGEERSVDPSAGRDEARGPVSRFARELGVAEEDLRGALDPASEPPYLHIDPHYWEALRKNSPTRGPGTIAPLRLAATAAVLWFRSASLGDVSVEQAKQIMTEANLSDSYPKRTLEGTSWLRIRSGNLALNPAQVSQAQGLVRAFCLKQKPDLKSKA